MTPFLAVTPGSKTCWQQVASSRLVSSTADQVNQTQVVMSRPARLSCGQGP